MAAKKTEKKNGKIMGGIFLVILGVIFLLNNFGYTTLDLGRLWPLFLIIPGIFMLFESNKKSS